MPYTANELAHLPTLCVSQADDLKIETPTLRVWLSRCTVADGELCNDKITHEEYLDGRWEITECYHG